MMIKKLIITVFSSLVVLQLILIAAFSTKLMPIKEGIEEASTHKELQEYKPASVEDYVLNNLKMLGYDKENQWISGCNLFNDIDSTAGTGTGTNTSTNDITTKENHNNLENFRRDLDSHSKALKEFDSNKTVDLLKKIRKGKYLYDGNQMMMTELCKNTRPHPLGLQALFPSNQLSLTKSGYVEPLIPPLRSPHFCGKGDYGLSLNFLVHDFEAICLNLKPTSRMVLIDMGAALDFHGSVESPIFELITTFEKFGFKFDHIYAFEIKEKDPTKVYRDYLPVEYFTSYHWINSGVSADKGDKMNPLISIVKQFDEDDFVMVKLDIDTPHIENPMVKLLLEDDSINRLVDHFYFEHHVMISELKKWGDLATGSIGDSLTLMHNLRKKGVAAHYWP